MKIKKVCPYLRYTDSNLTIYIDHTDPDKDMETAKRETVSVFQYEDDFRSETDQKFCKILSNTAKAYSYQLIDEYMMHLLKSNNMKKHIDKYIELIDINHKPLSTHILDLGRSSLERFLVLKEKRVYQTPPLETDSLLVIRNGEFSSKLKITEKTKRKISMNCYYTPKQVEVINETVDMCNEVLTPVRKKTSKWDIAIMIYLLVGIVVCLTIGISLGIYVHYSPAIVVSFLYILGFFILLFYSKKNAHTTLLSSHLCMSLVTSYINMKHHEYLSKNALAIHIKFRPGYLGKWLEIHNTVNSRHHTEERRVVFDLDANQV